MNNKSSLISVAVLTLISLILSAQPAFAQYTKDTAADSTKAQAQAAPAPAVAPVQPQAQTPAPAPAPAPEPKAPAENPVQFIGPAATAAPSPAIPAQAPAEAASDAQTMVIPPSPVKEEAPPVEVNELFVYGEVAAINTGANSITLYYYNYDTEEERTIDITAGVGTKIQNAAALGDIKKGDWADVTYIVKDEKNVARSIKVEKDDAVEPVETKKAD